MCYHNNCAHSWCSLEMFESEAQELEALKQTEIFRIPEVLCYGRLEGSIKGSWLLLEYIHFGFVSDKTEQKFARKLAKLHSCTSEQGFGFHSNNYHCYTKFNNSWTSDWVTFFRCHYLFPIHSFLLKITKYFSSTRSS
jgi:fructosamine-3-kinase